MRSRALAAAIVLPLLAGGCRAGDPPTPPRVTTVVVPPGAPPKQLTRCADGTWSTATGSGVCSHHGGVKVGR